MDNQDEKAPQLIPPLTDEQIRVQLKQATDKVAELRDVMTIFTNNAIELELAVRALQEDAGEKMILLNW